MDTLADTIGALESAEERQTMISQPCWSRLFRDDSSAANFAGQRYCPCGDYEAAAPVCVTQIVRPRRIFVQHCHALIEGYAIARSYRSRCGVLRFVPLKKTRGAAYLMSDQAGDRAESDHLADAIAQRDVCDER